MLAWVERLRQLVSHTNQTIRKVVQPDPDVQRRGLCENAKGSPKPLTCNVPVERLRQLVSHTNQTIRKVVQPDPDVQRRGLCENAKGSPKPWTCNVPVERLRQLVSHTNLEAVGFSHQPDNQEGGAARP